VPIKFEWPFQNEGAVVGAKADRLGTCSRDLRAGTSAMLIGVVPFCAAETLTCMKLKLLVAVGSIGDLTAGSLAMAANEVGAGGPD